MNKILKRLVKRQLAISFGGLIVILFILSFVSPAYAFDPLTAEKKTLELAKYIIIVATLVGAVRSLIKSNFVVALLVIAAGGIVYALVDPAALYNLGSGILSYLSLLNDGANGPSVNIQPAPVTPSP